MRFGLFVLAMLVAAETAADAECDCLPKLSPESGSVPLRGSLYLDEVNLIERGEVSVRWTGPPGTATWTVHDGIARLDYSGPDGSELVVVTFGRYERAWYKLESRWRAPTAAPRATRFTHEKSEWTCASTDALFIKLDQSTAAVRVHWTHMGVTETLLLAADGGVALGHLGCCGTYIEVSELHDGGALELVAIRVDGSEARVLDVPSYLSSNMYGPELTGDSYVAEDEPHPDETSAPQWLGVFLAVGLLFPLVYISRRISR